MDVNKYFRDFREDASKTIYAWTGIEYFKPEEKKPTFLQRSVSAITSRTSIKTISVLTITGVALGALLLFRSKSKDHIFEANVSEKIDQFCRPIFKDFSYKGEVGVHMQNADRVADQICSSAKKHFSKLEPTMSEASVKAVIDKHWKDFRVDQMYIERELSTMQGLLEIGQFAQVNREWRIFTGPITGFGITYSADYSAPGYLESTIVDIASLFGKLRRAYYGS